MRIMLSGSILTDSTRRHIRFRFVVCGVNFDILDQNSDDQIQTFVTL